MHIRNIHSFIALLALVGGMSAASAGDSPTLEEGFVNPPHESRPRTWWHWMNDNVTKYGVTRDLEAMERIGLKGAHITNIGGGNAPHGDEYIMSPSWMDVVEHAAKECARLGLELGTSGGEGCSGSGGPWITPEYSMQDVVWRHKFVKGPVKGKIQLPQPRVNLDYYRDIAVLAFPTIPGDSVPVSTLKPKITYDGGDADWTKAMDGDPETFTTVPRQEHGVKSTALVFEFEKPVPVRSMSLQLDEVVGRRQVKVYTSNDGKKWTFCSLFQHLRGHVPNGREEMIEGFHPRESRFVKIEFLAPSHRLPFKLYELNFQTSRLNQLQPRAARMRGRPQMSDPTSMPVPEDQIIAMDAVIDLTDKVQPGGEVKCDLPAGDWTILRFGHTSKANNCKPSSKAAEGLEVDKFSVEAIEYNFKEGMHGNVVKRLGPLVGDVYSVINLDSWEAGCQTWTAKFPEKFRKLRGYYDPKWMITLTGRIVGSVDQADRYLWDYRRTVADLLIEGYYGTFKKLCNENGMLLEGEAPGTGIPVIADGIQSAGMMDIPQGEFWLGGDAHPVHGWKGGNDNTKEAAAAAHVYGREVASCEAFTSFGHHDGWTQYPHILKPVGDRQFCKGMNEIVFHCFAHQPDDRFPGMTLGQFGLNFQRNLTWWEQGRAWVDYLTRCQFMLRQGRFFADVIYYYGEDAPGSAYYYVPDALDPRKMMKPVLPAGYDYDVSDRVILDRMEVEDGHVVLPSGMRYSYLVLPDSARYTVSALEQVHKLVKDGATVIGPRPSRSPSMKDYPKADSKIQKLAEQIWPEKDGPGERRVGKGRVITGRSFEEILKQDKLLPDFSVDAAHDDSEVCYIHRKIDGGDMYFVSHQKDRPEEVVLTFRVTGKVPEIWDPVTGKKVFTPVYRDDGTRTSVSLRMENFDSKFVIFRKETKEASVVDLQKGGKRVKSVSGSIKKVAELSPTIVGTTGGEAQLIAWEPGEYEVKFSTGDKKKVKVQGVPAPETVPDKWFVSFQRDRGAPVGQIEFEKLSSWTERAEDGIKYFSGTATYVKGVNVSTERLESGRRVYLDLGDVKYVAEVAVNDKPLGVLWKKPFRVDITDAAKPGANKVQVKVTNVWKNRIVGDHKLPEDKRVTWSAWPFHSADAPLMESGMLGPVRVLSSESVSLQK